MATAEGSRKHGLAALLIGGAVAQHQWPIALAAFAVYVVANVIQGIRAE